MGNECWGQTVNPLLVGFGMIYQSLWAVPAIVLAFAAGRCHWRIVWRGEDR